ncbi:Recombination inhibitory protein MutS2 [Fulvivirga imtechensis AK7]|uniref:Endonuclease MutS2 n=1 Tax=Fulvivirga imtechensis AK7 TaxID=1237149 RepID=L8JW32_9BACT|nr:endonuclease MutS2 [Fulvivirga imtechensis]ELR71814.1 Recombination inhibitory protein MutS2 [Fulvivirga imtechensis AK7]
MLYPTDIEQKLGFDKVRSLLKEKCLSTLGANIVDKIRLSHSPDQIHKLLLQTDEFSKIITANEPFPSNHFLDVSSALGRAKTAGVFLTEEEFLNINRSLQTVLACVRFLNNRQESYPQLHELTGMADFDPEVCDHISAKIDDAGYVKDNASDQLANIRQQLRAKHAQVRRTLDQIYKSAVKEGYVPEGASMTVRDGRMVIPVMAEFKRRIKGFVHDESATGQTVYLEPTEVLEGNNEIRELENSEKREVVRILTRLTDMLRFNLEGVQKAYQFLSFIDFIRAKARLAIEMKAIMPEVKALTDMKWREARHPLLYLAYQKQGKKVVPLSIDLDKDQRLVIISGPNAGGKSVALKTVGLIQYMLQCGLLVPLGEQSVAGIFNNIFIDIGDEQSIENDLSTYSSHLTNMKFFLKHTDKKTLCLIDEFGTGTDPHYGGAIAEAILDKLVELQGNGVITTHYSNIKHYAENKPGVVNGAMKFDMAHLEPLYELEIGKPGSSFSLEIARKIGLSLSIVDYAREVIGSKTIDVDNLIMKLEKQEQEIAMREKAARETEQQMKNLKNKYDQLYDQLEGKKKEIIDAAKKEAAQLLSTTNREIEKTIRHIKTTKAEKKETKKMRERLGQLKEKISAEEVIKEHQEQKIKAVPGAIAVGDSVRIIDNDVVGEVLDMRGKDVEVQVGDLKTVVKLKRLEKVSRSIARQASRTGKVSSGMDISKKMAEFSPTLDVRGKRAEEVLGIIDKFIDDAILFNMQEVRILHGKGNGILKDLIRNYLKDSNVVSTIADEHVERGGAGISVVVLK